MASTLISGLISDLISPKVVQLSATLFSDGLQEPGRLQDVHLGRVAWRPEDARKRRQRARDVIIPQQLRVRVRGRILSGVPQLQPGLLCRNLTAVHGILPLFAWQSFENSLLKPYFCNGVMLPWCLDREKRRVGQCGWGLVFQCGSGLTRQTRQNMENHRNPDLKHHQWSRLLLRAFFRLHFSDIVFDEFVAAHFLVGNSHKMETVAG